MKLFVGLVCDVYPHHGIGSSNLVHDVPTIHRVCVREVWSLSRTTISSPFLGNKMSGRGRTAFDDKLLEFRTFGTILDIIDGKIGGMMYTYVKV